MSMPIILPDLGAGKSPVTISGWLVDPGDRVEAGDRVVEVLLPGVTFDVPAPAAGVLTRVVAPTDAQVAVGDVLGWIEEDP